MAMAYFSPGQGMLRRLGRVARRGHARFVMAGKSDNAATVGASRLLYGYLLRKQADVWEYRPCKLHMKLIVVDDVTYIGSANFDARSLFLNVEMMVWIADAEFATRMRRSEEHTSELQSLMRISYAVFCLKKKKKTKNH